jgi:hypothetical protein
MNIARLSFSDPCSAAVSTSTRRTYLGGGACAWRFRGLMSSTVVPPSDVTSERYGERSRCDSPVVARCAAQVCCVGLTRLEESRVRQRHSLSHSRGKKMMDRRPDQQGKLVYVEIAAGDRRQHARWNRKCEASSEQKPVCFTMVNFIGERIALGVLRAMKSMQMKFHNIVSSPTCKNNIHPDSKINIVLSSQYVLVDVTNNAIKFRKQKGYAKIVHTIFLGRCYMSGFSEQGVSYTPLSRPLIGASRSVLVFYFALSNNFSFFYISHSIQPLNLKLCSSLKQWDRMWENSWGFLLYYIYTFYFFWILNIWKS